MSSSSTGFHEVLMTRSKTAAKRLTSLLLFAASLAATGWSQLATSPSFDVASVKPDNDCRNPRPGKTPTPGRLNMECITLLNLIRTAYVAYANGTSLDYTRVPIESVPDWASSEQYDIAAIAPGPARFEQMAGPMLQHLLEDRFKLKIRAENRSAPVYALVVANGGTKMRAVPDSECSSQPSKAPATSPALATPPNGDFCGRMTMKRNGEGMLIEAHGMTVTDFATGLLASRLDRPVIDKTGMTGRFDFRLEFAPLSVAVGSPDGAQAPNNESSSIFTAVQEQLGLKLTPEKNNVKVLVVDHAEKPSAN